MFTARIYSTFRLKQLVFRFHWPEEKAALVKKNQAGVIIWKGIHYKAPKEPAPVEDFGDPFL